MDDWKEMREMFEEFHLKHYGYEVDKDIDVYGWYKDRTFRDRFGCFVTGYNAGRREVLDSLKNKL